MRTACSLYSCLYAIVIIIVIINRVQHKVCWQPRAAGSTVQLSFDCQSAVATSVTAAAAAAAGCDLQCVHQWLLPHAAQLPLRHRAGG
jgi:hypothetical protein